MKPLHKFCLVLPQAKEKVSAGGIVLPDNADREKPIKGRVLSIGDLVTKVDVGQNVLFKRYAPYEYEDENSGDKLLFVEEQDILGVL